MPGRPRILLAAGSNAKGQLGIGTYEDAHTFTPCQFAGRASNQLDPTSTVVQVACGANHTVLLFESPDGSTTLWGAGDGGRGQLGRGYLEEGRRARTQAPWTVFHELRVALTDADADAGVRTYKHVAAAWETTYVVLASPGRSDVVLSMGSNEYGALGIGAAGTGAGDCGEPQVVDFGHVFPDVDDGGRLCVRALRTGPRHVVAELVTTDVDANGSSCHRTAIIGWGASRHGQLGENHAGTRFVARPTRLPINGDGDGDGDPVVSCALGNQHTVVLHASGRMSALGSNKQGQIPPSLGSQRRGCGLGCTWSGTYVHATDGEKDVLLAMGNDAQGQLGRGHTVESTDAVDLPAGRAMVYFVCGSEHVLAAMSTGNASREVDSIVGWGWNEHGNMGLGSLGNITIPAQLWPRQDMDVYREYPQKVVGFWAGCATSWLLVE